MRIRNITFRNSDFSFKIYSTAEEIADFCSEQLGFDSSFVFLGHWIHVCFMEEWNVKKRLNVSANQSTLN